MDSLALILSLDWFLTLIVQILLPGLSEVVPDVAKGQLLTGDLSDLYEMGLFRFIMSHHQPELTSQHYRLAHTSVTKVNDREIIKALLKDRDVKRGSSYDRLSHFFGTGIFTSIDHHKWFEQRGIMLDLFSTTKLKAQRQETYEYINAIMDDLPEQIDLVPGLSQITLRVFCKVMLDVDVSSTAPVIVEPLNALLSYIAESLEPFTLPWDSRFREFKKNVTVVHQWLSDVIDRLPDSDTSLHRYLRNPKVDRQEKIEMFLAIVLGGHETTSRVLLGTLYSIYTNEQIRGGLYYTCLACHDFEGPDYLLWNVKEGLRMYPPVWLVSRE